MILIDVAMMSNCKNVGHKNDFLNNKNIKNLTPF